VKWKLIIALLGSVGIATIASLSVFQSPSAESIRSALAATTLDHLLFQDAPAREPVTVMLVTHDEHARLSASGLRSVMPRDWDGADIFARYAAVGIEVAPEIRPSN